MVVRGLYIWELRVGSETSSITMQRAQKSLRALIISMSFLPMCFQVGFSDSTAVIAVLLGNNHLHVG